VYTTLGLLQAVGIGVTAIVVGILRSSDASLVLWSTYTPLTQEYGAFVAWPSE
jgi:hypothetical protein